MAASTSTEVSERDLKKLSSQLKSIPENMRIFSLNIRSLYAEKAVGSLSEVGVEFNRLRDDIRNDSLVYVKAILPMSTKFVRIISDFFSEYEAMEFGDWKECLDDTLEEVRGYRQFCEVLLFLHEEVMTGLKAKEGQANILVKKLATTSKEFEMKVKEMTEAASLKTKLAAIMMFFPTVGPIVATGLDLYSQYERSSAVAYQEEAGLYGAASAVVSGTLIPALAAFLNALRESSAFFSVLEHSLIPFQDKGLDAKGKIDLAKENNREAQVKKHYRIMRLRAGEIRADCDKYFAVLPDMKTDFAVINEEGTDTNHVQAWLGERRRIIRQKLRGQITELVQSQMLDPML